MVADVQRAGTPGAIPILTCATVVYTWYLVLLRLLARGLQYVGPPKRNSYVFGVSTQILTMAQVLKNPVSIGYYNGRI